VLNGKSAGQSDLAGANICLAGGTHTKLAGLTCRQKMDIVAGSIKDDCRIFYFFVSLRDMKYTMTSCTLESRRSMQINTNRSILNTVIACSKLYEDIQLHTLRYVTWCIQSSVAFVAPRLLYEQRDARPNRVVCSHQAVPAFTVMLQQLYCDTKTIASLDRCTSMLTSNKCTWAVDVRCGLPLLESSNTLC
jgi:hypothetical protein